MGSRNRRRPPAERAHGQRQASEWPSRTRSPDKSHCPALGFGTWDRGLGIIHMLGVTHSLQRWPPVQRIRPQHNALAWQHFIHKVPHRRINTQARQFANAFLESQADKSPCSSMNQLNLGRNARQIELKHTHRLHYVMQVNDPSLSSRTTLDDGRVTKREGF